MAAALVSPSIHPKFDPPLASAVDLLWSQPLLGHPIHLLIIINEILDSSTMEAGKAVLQSEAFHLPGAVSDALRSLAFLAHQKGLELALRIAPDVPADLTGDKVRLAQVLINLLGNAIKFAEHGEVCVDVSLLAVTHGRACLQFSVRDTGIGIPPNHQEGVFQAFQQAHSSGKQIYGVRDWDWQYRGTLWP